MKAILRQLFLVLFTLPDGHLLSAADRLIGVQSARVMWPSMP